MAQNDQVVALGLAWLERCLAGEEAGAERATWEEARQAMLASGEPAALDRLGALFSLSPFEEDVLLLALAPEVDGRFGPRYGTAQGRLSAAAVSPHLLARLLTGSERLPPQALQSLSPGGMLRRFALIELDERDLAVHAAITLPERIRLLLCGIEASDDPADLLTRPVPLVSLPDRLEASSARIAASPAVPLQIQIVGPRRSGRRGLAAAIAARLGLGCRRLTGRPSGASELAALARECVLNNCALLIEIDDTDGSDEAARNLRFLLPMPLFIVSERPVDGLEDLPVLRLPALQADERLTIWRRSLLHPAEADLASLAEHFALGPSEIDAIARRRNADPAETWSACRELGSRDLEALTTRIVPERGWDDMVLDPDVLADLQGLAGQISRRSEVHRDWGYRRILGRATGISALFAGPSGVGKTMAAEAIAKALDLDLYVIDLARVTSKYIGETEKNLSRIFSAAEAGGCVLFFDEADALFGKRSEVKDSHDRYANAEISYLLQRMENFGGLSILATNLKSHLDTAFLRRIRIIVDFPVPNASVRRRLWQRALPPTAPQYGIDWDALARQELTGGNIATIATNAAFRASAEGEAIGMSHVMAAMAAEFRKLDRDSSTLGARR
ncbi:AAA family ATPase [Kaistia soli]|uniref:AAA family ATPase n=1 Tax=Kaistia soli TaxID=446684 RepID=UPI001114B109|nr:ATP-binding protein [Kaistia soli]